MNYKEMQLRLVIASDPETDDEELQQLTIQLRNEILDLDVEAVSLVEAEEAPAGTKAGAPVTWGTLLVTLAASGGVLTALVNLLKSWLVRNEQRSITLEIEGDRLEVTGLSSEEQQHLINDWMSRHRLVITAHD
jgi:hypothetical protein